MRDALAATFELTRRHALMCCCLALVCAGCAATVPVQKRFPTPLIEALPVDVGVYFTRRFHVYEYHEEDNHLIVPVGPAQVALFNKVFAAMFAETVPVKTHEPSSPKVSGLDAVIEPAVKSYDVITPQQSGSKYFTVTISYHISLYATDGKLIASWLVSGFGRSRTHLFHASQSLAKAANVAMRDAAAEIAINFKTRPRVKQWLARTNATEGHHDGTTI